ncbi:hypothetical protein [Clostridium perfringens]|uniref:hypothetical protein n=1 Tax=Clostridium perfringens TaxID=1502 RepID=UPI003CFAB93E
MKKFLGLFLSITLILGLIILPNPILNNKKVVLAKEKKSFALENNKIRLRVTKDASFSDYWGEFGFVNVGNNEVKLRPIYNGKPVHYSEFPDNIQLNKPIGIKIINNNGEVYGSAEFIALNKVKDIARFLEAYNLKYGVDSIQIIPFYDNNPFTITGNIKSNLNYYDYETKISKKQAQNFKFRVEPDGLYAEYIPQTVIPDGVYIIETGDNSNNVLSHENTTDLLSINFNNSINQKFLLKYDKKNKAYKIISQKNGYLLTCSEYGNKNIYMIHDNDFSGQLWYLQKLPNGNYRIVSSLNTTNRITFNLNNNSVKSEYMKDDITQEFRLVKTN